MLKSQCDGRLGLLGLTALIVVLSILVGNALASSSAVSALRFETTTGWSLVEGSGPLATSTTHTEGEAALQVGGTYWRRLSSALLAVEGEPLGSFAIDVKVESELEGWETIGVVLKAPSVGVWWGDLGQAPLGGTSAGVFQRKSFAVPEQIRQAIRMATDLTILIAVNTRGTVHLDNAALFGSAPPEAAPPDPILNPPPVGANPRRCASRNVHVTEMDGDFADIWAGRESTETGKQAEPLARASISFDAAVDPSLVIGTFVPEGNNCGTPIPATGANWKRAWTLTAPPLGVQAIPRDFNVVVRRTVQGIPDAGGPVAAGGDVTLQGFSLNHVANQPYGLIGGGKLTLGGGAIRGDVRYAVPSGIPGTVSVNGTAALGAVVDFDGLFANLRRFAQGLSNMPATGDSSLAWSTLTLTGTIPKVNVFEVESAVLAQARSIAVNVPEGASAVVNVTGLAPRIENVGVSLDGVTPSRLVWNAAQAKAVSISGVSLPGTLLAPSAAVTFANGNLQGTLVSESLTGQGSFQHHALEAQAIAEAGLGANTVEIAPQSPLRRGCTYAFVLPQANSLTYDGQCLASPVKARFRVAQSGSAPAREIIPRAADRDSGMLRRFEIVDGINTPAQKAFARYASRLGLGADDLLPASHEVASRVVSGGTSSFYQQHVQGIPVHGHGYFVHSEDGNLRAAVGKVMSGLSLSLQPTLDEGAALVAFRDQLGLSTIPADITGSPLEGHLEIYANRGRPKAEDFLLVWRFDLPPSLQVDATIARIDAHTGEVVLLSPRLEAAVTPSDAYIGQANHSVATVYNGEQSISAGVFQTGSGQEYALSSGPLGAPGTLGLVLYTGLPNSKDVVPANWPFVWASGSDASWSSPLERNLASAYWASQSALLFGDSLALEFDGAPWLGIDGTGETPVRVWYDTTGRFLFNGPNAFFFKDADSLEQSNMILAADLTSVPLNLEVLAHEHFHGMVHNARDRQGIGDLGVYREAGSISEGLADIFGIAAKRALSPDDASWACMTFETTCFRNIADPKSVQHPARYLGQYFNDFSGSSDEACKDSETRCGTHLNSTVVSHWGYLLAHGSGGSIPDSCNVVVDPLEGTLDEALADTLDVAFQATASNLLPDPTFDDLRDATIFAAEGMLGHEAGRKVETAWYAVGVGDQPALISVVPADGAVDVEPWRTAFSWVSETNGPWELVLAEDPSFETELGTYPVAAILHPDGTYRGSLSVTLTPGKRYHWRVKREGADILCWLMTSSFETAAKQVELVSPAMPLNGYYQTGFLGEVDWQLTGGNRDYLVRLSDVKLTNACSSGTTEWGDSKLALGDSYDTLYERHGVETLGDELDPDHTYYLYIQPTFDSDLSPAEQERGTCSEFKVRQQRLGSFQSIAPMRGPASQMLLAFGRWEDEPRTVLKTPFVYSVSDGAVAYQLQITSADGANTIVYDETRELGHCGLKDRNGRLAWFLTCSDFPIAEQIDGEPRLDDVVRGGDLFWHVYAVASDGSKRKSWHVGDEQPTPGNSSEEAYFNFLYEFMPPRAADHAIVLAGFTAKHDGLPESAVFDDGYAPYSYPAEAGDDAEFTHFGDTVVAQFRAQFRFPADETMVRRFMLAKQGSWIMTGMRYWYYRDQEPLQGPFIFDFATESDLFVQDETPFVLRAPGSLLHLLYEPLELNYGGPGEHRSLAQYPTHIISEVYADAPEPPEPGPQPEPGLECATPGEPEIDPYLRVNLLEDYSDDPAVLCANVFSMTLHGFAFGWEKVPGAVKYRVEVYSIFALSDDELPPLMAEEVDGDTTSFRRIPPIAYLPGCGYAGYIFQVSAVNSCGEVGPPATGAIGYAGPFSNFP